jgi:hypothetical protein
MTSFRHSERFETPSFASRLNSEAVEMYFTSDPLAFVNERFISGIGRSAERANRFRGRFRRWPNLLAASYVEVAHRFGLAGRIFQDFSALIQGLAPPYQDKISFWHGTPHGYLPFGGHSFTRTQRVLRMISPVQKPRHLDRRPALETVALATAASGLTEIAP